MRTEQDSMGEVEIPDGALWGAQTQRAINNFPISGMPLPPRFIQALGLIKSCAAHANGALGELDVTIAESIEKAANQIADGEFLDQFPVDVYQTGSGTSSNMNANEVIASLANKTRKEKLHPNDHVNRGQSSNDVIPTAIHISAFLAVEQQLIPALEGLIDTLRERERKLSNVIKTGRTHLMDAMPITMGQELSGWRNQIERCVDRLTDVLPRLSQLAIGGTAVGTGVNAHPEFATRFCERLSASTGFEFAPAADRFAVQSSQNTAVELSGQLNVLGCALMKICNDLRLMNSGPLSGIGEIALPAVQPGSSIMPGKVNPVIPEAVAMVCAQVAGNHMTVTIAGQSGQFQLNVMLPVIAHSVLESIALLSNSCQILGENAIRGFQVNQETIDRNMSRNPILVTALNSEIGYSKAAEIAKRAYAESRPVIDVAEEMTDLPRSQLEALLDPRQLT